MTAPDEPDFTPLRAALVRGDADDAAFDAVYPEAVRARSSRFWTPVAVATRAAQLLSAHGAHRVLDVGSGAGKFCLVAGAVCSELDLTGVEQRPHLIAAARVAAARLGLDNVRFVEGDATRVAWAEIDGLYLFNPFAENIYTPEEHLGETVELSQDRFFDDVRSVVVALHAAPLGACMVTYHGFGGPIPASFRLAHTERAHHDWLRVWVKSDPSAPRGTFYVERRDTVELIDRAAHPRNADADAAPAPGGAALTGPPPSGPRTPRG